MRKFELAKKSSRPNVKVQTLIRKYRPTVSELDRSIIRTHIPGNEEKESRSEWVRSLRKGLRASDYGVVLMSCCGLDEGGEDYGKG